MSAKKIIVAALIIVVAIGGFVAGLLLLQERQDLREEASVPSGQAQVYITPATGNYEVGDTIQASVYFNPANIAISGVAVRLSYPFSGTTPAVRVEDINISPSILSSTDWSCPTQNATQQGGEVFIDIGCANTSSSGFRTDADTLLANINMKIDTAPDASPLVLEFEHADSIITRRSDNQDVLLIPSSVGTYTIAGVSAEATPTPTAQTTVSPTATATGTVTTTATKTPTPTTTATLPNAGISYPTILGVGLGFLFVFLALMIAF